MISADTRFLACQHNNPHLRHQRVAARLSPPAVLSLHPLLLLCSLYVDMRNRSPRERVRALVYKPEPAKFIDNQLDSGSSHVSVCVCVCVSRCACERGYRGWEFFAVDGGEVGLWNIHRGDGATGESLPGKMILEFTFTAKGFISWMCVWSKKKSR